MNKKLKHLAFIPFYGTYILLVYLFVLSLKNKISRKRFFTVFIVAAIICSLCFYATVLISFAIRNRINNSPADIIAMILAMIFGGYLMNALAFTYIDKNWHSLYSENCQEESSPRKWNTKKILTIAFVVALIISAVTLVAIFALGLV